MTCKKCGADNGDRMAFCQQCGSPLGQQSNTKSDDAAKKKRRRTFFIILIIVVALALFYFDPLGFFEDTGGGSGGGGGDSGGGDGGGEGQTVEIGDLRDRYTVIKGNGEDTITIMLYICAADLESRGGCATQDLIEMANAVKSDKVNIIIQTGGTTSWNNDVMSSSRNERYRLNKDSSFERLDSGLGQLNMTDYRTLRDFIKFAKNEYPADRYMLIFWDHGGGTLGGFGYDENFPNSSGMSISNIDKALNEAGVKFDFVGFDACLMATFETAYMLEDHADYLIASEETEPGTGWYYTDWLSALCANTSMPTRELGKLIVDDFVESISYGESATLSVLELREIPYLYSVLCTYLDNAQAKLTAQDFKALSQARARSYSYGEGGYDQIDMFAFVSASNVSEASDVQTAIRSIVTYYRTVNAGDSNGLAMYFPYSFLEYYSPMLSVQKSIGMTSDYTNFFGDFVTVMAGGQIHSGSEVDYSDADWFDSSLADNYGDYYEDYSYNELEIVEKTSGGETYYALPLTDKDWDIIAQIEIQAFYDDGEGFIDLGSDNVWEVDDDGHLMIVFDNTWVALDGNVVSFYYLYETEPGADYWFTYGYTPGTLNGDVVDIIIRWDDDNPQGYVAGAKYPTSSSGQSAKGLIPLKDGDKLKFLLDYYDYNGDFDDQYYYNFTLTVNGDIEVSYEDVGDGKVYIWYLITDIYGNIYTTESVVYE